MHRMTDDWSDELAVVSHLPYRDGDGYSYGGDTILTIGKRSIALASQDDKFAKEVARRWNAGRSALAQSEEKKL